MFEHKNKIVLRSVLTILSAVFFFAVLYQNVAVVAPDISAGGVVLMEMKTKRVLYEVNAHKKLPMASTTKIMTGLLAVEHGGFSEIITVPAQASGVEGSSMYLEKGEKISFENLVYGLMIASGNDAAVAIALHIGGSIEGFVEMMNLKAKEIGAKNTNFCNPNGLPNSNHYTTAYDLALIAAYAMENDAFRKIVSTKERTMDWQGHEWDRVLRSKNRILLQYKGGNGIKTGYTKAAGKCLVSGAERDGMQLISVVLNCGNMFGQSMELLDYGFSEMKPMVVAKKGKPMGTIAIEKGIEPYLELSVKNDIVVPLKQGELDTVKTKVILEKSLKAPVEAGQSGGKVEVYLDGKLIMTEELITTADVPAATYEYYLDKVWRGWLRPIVE